MINSYLQRFVSIAVLAMALAGLSNAQSTRPRRVKPARAPRPAQNPADEPLLRPEPKVGTTARSNPNAPLINVQPVKPVVNTTGTGDTSHAYLLLQQGQFAAAAKEAKDVAANYPNDAEAWKIAGFAELNLKQYNEAASDLEKAVSLQRATKQEDPNTVDALAQSYVLSEKFQQALPLLVTATTRAGTQPDAGMLYYRGLAEYKTGKAADAERTFNAVVKLNPKDSLSLFYLGQIALSKNDLDGAIAALNRVTVNDPRLASAWTLLTSVYLRRAALSTDTAKADADYLNAVRAGEGLIKVRTDVEAITLFGQALIGAQQYARAAAALERAALERDAKGVTFYLLGDAYSRLQNFPKAIAALEKAVAAGDASEVTFYLLGVAYSRTKNFPKAISALASAAAKSPNDVNIYPQLGYAYEMTKQYERALGAYQKGASLVPNDTELKEAIERVRHLVK